MEIKMNSIICSNCYFLFAIPSPTFDVWESTKKTYTCPTCDDKQYIDSDSFESCKDNPEV